MAQARRDRRPIPSPRTTLAFRLAWSRHTGYAAVWLVLAMLLVLAPAEARGKRKAAAAEATPAASTPAVDPALFETLDWLEGLLATRKRLAGDETTEADWRLFTTLVRFDAVYFGHFKTNRQRIEDYRHLPAYVRDLYQQSGVAATVDLPYIKQHYYGSHGTINPTGIVPLGQELDFSGPHGREAPVRAVNNVA